MAIENRQWLRYKVCNCKIINLAEDNMHISIENNYLYLNY